MNQLSSAGSELSSSASKDADHLNIRGASRMSGISNTGHQSSISGHRGPSPVVSGATPPPRPPRPSSNATMIPNDTDDEDHLQSSTRHHIYLNPVFESATYIKRKLLLRLKRHNDENMSDGDEDEDDVKSLSIDSVYITPVVHQPVPKELVRATNYFIATAIIVSFILVFMAFYLILGESSESDLFILL